MCRREVLSVTCYRDYHPGVNANDIGRALFRIPGYFSPANLKNTRFLFVSQDPLNSTVAQLLIG